MKDAISLEIQKVLAESNCHGHMMSGRTLLQEKG